MNFLSAEPHSDFLTIIWDPRKNSVESYLALYQGALYRGSSVSGHTTANQTAQNLYWVFTFSP